MQSPVITSTIHPSFGMTIFRFIRRLSILLFLTFDATAGMVYLLYSRLFRWAELIPTILAVFCGLSAGVFSRWIFKDWPRIIRWFFSCASAAAILAGLGILCQKWLMIDLTGVTSALIEPDFFILFSMACVSAFLAIFSWRKKVTIVQPREQTTASNIESMQLFESSKTAFPQRTPINQRVMTSRKRSFSIIPVDLQRRYFKKSSWRRVKKKIHSRWKSLINFGRRSILVPIKTFFHPGVHSQRWLKNPVRSLQIHVPEHRTASPSTFPTPLPRKHPNRKAHQTVRLIGKEELRCPYCLQVIDRRDPKGIVVCPICHSAHHKECWDITGSCQVPHNHAVL